MGMDSVELVMMVEDYFAIRIANRDAEKISTVQDMADVVANHLQVTSNNMQLHINLLAKLRSYINVEIGLQDLIANYLPNNDDGKWQILEQQLGLTIPKPEVARKYSSKLRNKLQKLLSWIPDYDWQAITVAQFITAICACNYQVLIKPTAIQNHYEIYVAIVGITVDKIGVDYYEISPDKSFTSDLGVD